VITFGVDAHKSVHVALAVSDSGQELGDWRGPNSPEGWGELLKWSSSFGDSGHWGIEGAWGNGRGLAQHLVRSGATVYEINARWTAEKRRSARHPGKTDRLDARAVAQLVRQEAPDLPVVHQEDETAVLDLLTSEREAAVEESTRLRNRIHALLLQIDPQYRSQIPALGSARA
jgi:transposase